MAPLHSLASPALELIRGRRKQHKHLSTCLATGACALLASLPASALTFNWAFLNNGGRPAVGETTSGTITGLKEGLNDLKLEGISLFVGNSQNAPDNVTLVSSASGDGSITVTNGSVVDYDFVILSGDGNLEISALLNNYAMYYDYITDDYDINDVSKAGGIVNIFSSPVPAPVPGPLPLLGAGAAFGWTRKARRRISSSTFRF